VSIQKPSRTLSSGNARAGVVMVAIALAGAAGYLVYSQVENRKVTSARSSTRNSQADAKATLAYLVVLARERRDDVWERGSGVLGEQFIKELTPEAFTEAPWESPAISEGELLDVIDRCRRLFIQSPRLFGAMSFAAEEAGLREPALHSRARRVSEVVRSDFIVYHQHNTPGFQVPPSSAARDPLNPMVPIHGGTFVMGADEVFAKEHRVRLSNFEIQRHEVTNEEYRRFDPGRRFPVGKDTYPADSVDWYEAQGYAAWLGGSLSTEARWEYAARGAQGRKYPWGNEPPSRERANFLATDSRPASEPVGSHPRGSTPEGVEDLAGNVWEWCRDRFGVYSATPDPEIDPLGPLLGTGRVLRGGSYFYDATFLRAAARNNDLAASRYLNVGFRVASWL
jgi:formylglycine-generating enzyme required for sulfatase activity